MKENMKKITLYIVVFAVFALIVFLSLSAPLLVSDADFSIYNTGWNGTSELAVRTEQRGSFTPNIELAGEGSTEVTQRELTEYDVDPNQTSIMIIGPEQDFTEEEKEYVDNFLEQGGRLVLADNFGSANTLLEGLDTNSSFHSEPLLDMAFDKEPHFGIAYDVKEHDLTENVSHILLNNPTAVNKGEEAVSLLNSSRASWLDEGQTEEPEDMDRKDYDQYPLVTVEEYGEGELVLISDPSIFINHMNDRMDNDVFIENMLDYLSEDRENIIFDESKRDMDIVYSIIYTGNYPGRTTSAIIIFVLMSMSVFLIFPESKDIILRKFEELLKLFLKDEEEEKDPLTKVLNNHPEWDKKKLQMINDRFIKFEKGDGEVE